MPQVSILLTRTVHSAFVIKNELALTHYNHSKSIIHLGAHSWCCTFYALICMLNCFSRVWFFAILWTIVLQAHMSMGFSRQEYWNGYPFPSPEDLPNPGIKPRSPTLQEDSFLSELPGKPKNTEVGSLSLLQGIFPTQESNWGVLHCWQSLYQLSYLGSPAGKIVNAKLMLIKWMGR